MSFCIRRFLSICCIFCCTILISSAQAQLENVPYEAYSPGQYVARFSESQVNDNFDDFLDTFELSDSLKQELLLSLSGVSEHRASRTQLIGVTI